MVDFIIILKSKILYKGILNKIQSLTNKNTSKKKYFSGYYL